MPRIKARRICLYELHNPHEFENGKFGIREPKICILKRKFDEIDVALVPESLLTKQVIESVLAADILIVFKRYIAQQWAAYEFQIIEKRR